MSGDSISESERGYQSAESKRRFTLVAGLLGAAFFLGQFLLPLAVMLLVMFPATMLRDMKSLDLDGAAVVGDDLWVVEQTLRLNMEGAAKPKTTLALTRVRLEGLLDFGPAISLEGVATDTATELIAAGERLWVLGSSATAYYENGALIPLRDAKRPVRASQAFVYQGRPAVITLGATPELAALEGEKDARWLLRPLALGQPPGVGSLRSVQAVEAAGSLYLFGQLCSDTPDQCSLSYRELENPQWLPLVEEVCPCDDWTAGSIKGRPAVFLSESQKEGGDRLSVVTVTAGGPQRKPIESIAGTRAWNRWRPLMSGTRFLLIAEGIPGALHVAEIEDGRVARTFKRPGSLFPFGPNMVALMVVPQLLPIVLSLVLAFLLTSQMRRHRVPEYEIGAERRVFASLWQRALAQLVDLIPLVVGFSFPSVWMWRMFSDPERLFENGPTTFPLTMFALFIGAFLWMLAVLLVYSYLEGRFGKTPGKWLAGIQVLGTDLQPCGFGRACLRNLLTLVDGFFSFLVGALLVALTENWQRLGDMVARTVVVVDEKRA